MSAPRYDFGRNWTAYAALATEHHVAEAEQALARLIGRARLDGLSFLDIGCGSGLHAAAALRLGVRRLVALDYDAAAVEATRAMVGRHGVPAEIEIRRADVLDPATLPSLRFDVVYSWGVLHHTGDVRRAMRIAADRVAEGGLLAIAIYRRTPLCRFWAAEKRWYAQAGPAARRVARAAYASLHLAAVTLGGRNPVRFLAEYPGRNRGMVYLRDVDDWLGGCPYESLAPAEVEAIVTEAGFRLERRFVAPVRLGGLFGSGCDEFAFRRTG